MDRPHRLRASGLLRSVLREGSSLARPEFVLYHFARTGENRSRFGFVVSRRIGNAVVRNRVKRLLREASRPLIPRFRVPTDVVVVARPAIVEASLPELRDALEQTATRAGLLRT